MLLISSLQFWSTIIQYLKIRKSSSTPSRTNSIAVITILYKSIEIGPIEQPYMQFRHSVCEAVLPGIVELMAISILIGFFNLINSIFGVCFVIRNKIDVPSSLPRRSTRGYSTLSNTSEQGKESKKSKKNSTKKLNKSASFSPKKGENLLQNNGDDNEQSGSEAVGTTTMVHSQSQLMNGTMNRSINNPYNTAIN